MRMDLPIQQILQQPTSHHLINPCIHFINAPKTRPNQPNLASPLSMQLFWPWLSHGPLLSRQLLAKRIHSKLDRRVLF